MRKYLKRIVIAAVSAAAAVFLTVPAACAAGRDTDSVKEHLKALPYDAEGLAESGAAVFTSDGGRLNYGAWESFAKAVSQGESASVDAAGTSSGGTVVYHIDYNGADFSVVRDNSRDSSYLGSSYIERTCRYLILFGEGRVVIDGENPDGSYPAGTYECAVLASEIYGSMNEVLDAIDNDSEGVSAPSVIFDQRTVSGGDEILNDTREGFDTDDYDDYEEDWLGDDFGEIDDYEDGWDDFEVFDEDETWE